MESKSERVSSPLLLCAAPALRQKAVGLLPGGRDKGRLHRVAELSVLEIYDCQASRGIGKMAAKPGRLSPYRYLTSRIFSQCEDAASHERSDLSLTRPAAFAAIRMRDWLPPTFTDLPAKYESRIGLSLLSTASSPSSATCTLLCLIGTVCAASETGLFVITGPYTGATQRGAGLFPAFGEASVAPATAKQCFYLRKTRQTVSVHLLDVLSQSHGGEKEAASTYPYQLLPERRLSLLRFLRAS